MNFFFIILLWQHILYVVSRAGRQVESTCVRARETTYTNTGYVATTIL